MEVAFAANHELYSDHLASVLRACWEEAVLAEAVGGAAAAAARACRVASNALRECECELELELQLAVGRREKKNKALRFQVETLQLQRRLAAVTEVGGSAAPFPRPIIIADTSAAEKLLKLVAESDALAGKLVALQAASGAATAGSATSAAVPTPPLTAACAAHPKVAEDAYEKAERLWLEEGEKAEMAERQSQQRTERPILAPQPSQLLPQQQRAPGLAKLQTARPQLRLAHGKPQQAAREQICVRCNRTMARRGDARC